MNSPDKLSVNKPMSIWKRPVELKFGKLLPSLGKGAIAKIEHVDIFNAIISDNCL